MKNLDLEEDDMFFRINQNNRKLKEEQIKAQEELIKRREIAKQKSLEKSEQALKIKIKKIRSQQTILALALVGTIAVGSFYGINTIKANNVKDEIKVEITDTYSDGFVDGVKNDTEDHSGVWFNYSIMADAIVQSEDPVYTFYNTVNTILSYYGLNDDDKNRCLDELCSAVNIAANGKLVGEDTTLYTNFTWSGFLDQNHFTAEDNIEARKNFQDFIINIYQDSKELVEDLSANESEEEVVRNV